jgi:DNA-binding transcriptional MerR regulator
MLLWSIQIILISTLIIFLIHQIFEFLKSTLTVPKIKDLVDSPSQKYEQMIQNMSEQPSEIKREREREKEKEKENERKNEPQDRDAMKNELKDFLKNQLRNDSVVENSTEISSLEML